MMISFNLADQLLTSIISWLYPVYVSFKSIELPGKEDNKKWLITGLLLVSFKWLNASLIFCFSGSPSTIFSRPRLISILFYLNPEVLKLFTTDSYVPIFLMIRMIFMLKLTNSSQCSIVIKLILPVLLSLPLPLFPIYNLYFF